LRLVGVVITHREAWFSERIAGIIAVGGGKSIPIIGEGSVYCESGGREGGTPPLERQGSRSGHPLEGQSKRIFD
jgi:hypothetical protein